MPLISPGFAAGFVAGGQLHAVCHGTTTGEFAHGHTIAPSTLFQVGSVTKTTVAYAIAALAVEGKLDFDDRVGVHLPNCHSYLRDVTLAELLSHTGSLPQFFYPPDRFRSDLGLAVKRLDDELPMGRSQARGRFEYSNAGFLVLGAVLEAATGQRCEDAIGAICLEKLGVTGPCFDLELAIYDSLALGHVHAESGFAVARPWRRQGRSGVPTGGLMMSIFSTLEYARSLLDPQNAVIDAMLSRRVPTGNVGEVSALGWRVRSSNSGDVLIHGGASHGFSAFVCIAPEVGVAAAALANAADCDLRGIVDNLVQLTGVSLTDIDRPQGAVIAPRVIRGRFSNPYEYIDVDVFGDHLTLTRRKRASFSASSKVDEVREVIDVAVDGAGYVQEVDGGIFGKRGLIGVPTGQDLFWNSAWFRAEASLPQ